MLKLCRWYWQHKADNYDAKLYSNPYLVLCQDFLDDRATAHCMLEEIKEELQKTNSTTAV